MGWSSNSSYYPHHHLSDWGKYVRSLEDLWDNIYSEFKNYDYGKLSQTLRDEFDENLAMISELREKIRSSMSMSMSTEWREKYNQAVKALTEMKRNLKLSELINKKQLDNKIEELLTSWEEFSIYDFIGRSYRDFIQGQNATWVSYSNNTVGDFLGSVKSSISDSSFSYEMVEDYLRSLHRRDPVCSMKDLTCPDGV